MPIPMSRRGIVPLNRQIKKIVALIGVVFVAKEKKYMNEFQLKKLHAEIDSGSREMTEEELDILQEMFYQRFGTARNGMCLNPLFLLDNPFANVDLDNPEHYQTKKESLAVSEWQDKEYIDILENIEHQEIDKDMAFMCEQPNNCSSHKGYSFSCRCIRENFENPTQFNKWVDKTINELGTELKDLLPSRKKKSSIGED
jgi:hypothetical protein